MINLENWSLRFRLVFALLLILAVAGTSIALRSIDPTQADLDLACERCLVHTQKGFGLEGFSPVSQCNLSRIDRIDFGPGTIITEGGAYRDADEISLVLTSSRSSSVVEIHGDDLALGRLSTASGTLDIQSLGLDELRVVFVPLSNSESSRGELSLGDSCRVRATGYKLVIDGTIMGHSEDATLSAVFYPYGGAGRFSDQSTGFDFQVKTVDRTFEFASPMPISAIRFLDASGRCAGVSGGSVRIGETKTETTIPQRSCVRMDAADLKLRHLGMRGASSELDVSLNGQFALLELNDGNLIKSPMLKTLAIGLSMFLGFGIAVLGAKRLLHPGREPGGERVEAGKPGDGQKA